MLQTASGSPSTPAAQWYSLPVGGGGNQTKAIVSPRGFIFSGSDTTAGGGVSGGSTVVGTVNVGLAPPSSVPTAYAGTPYLSGNCYGMGIDPSSNDQTLYFWQSVRNGINLCQLWKTTNQGGSWTITAFPQLSVDGNEPLRASKNNQIAVDPNNSNVVYAGGTTSLYRSLDGGATQATVSAVGSATNAANGVNAILFDTTLGTTTFSSQTVTAHIYVSITGSGIWHSLNGGSTWALIASSPTDVGKGWIGSDGWAYFLGFAGGSGITRIAPGTYALTTISGTTNLNSFALDPADPSLAWAVAPGWSFYAFTGAVNGATAPSLSSQATGSNPVSNAPQCPWIKSTNLFVNEIYMDPLVATSTTSNTIGTGSKTFTVASGLNFVAGDIVRIRNTPTNTNYMLATITSYSGTTLVLNVGTTTLGTGVYLGATTTGGSGTFTAWTITKVRCWMAQGSGLDFLDAPLFGGGSISVTDQSGGIESLSGNAVIWPPGNNPLLIASDFPFHNVNVNPIGTTGLTYSSDPAGGIEDGNKACWVWNAPGTLYCVSVGFTGKSTDGGNTWTAFSGSSGVTYGHIAASTLNSIVICNWNASGALKYSTNGGSTWSTGTGGPTSVAGGAYSANINPLCVDDNGTYYVIGNNSPVYCFKSTNGGATWTQGTNGLGTNIFSPQLRAVPGNPGHLFQCDGWQYGFANSSPAAVIASHPVTASQMRFSADGGSTWTTFSNVAEAICVSVGKAKPGGNGYPSIFWIGWLSNVFGIYRIDNFNSSSPNTSNHTFIGDYVAGRTDLPVDIAGCMDVYDWCIVAYQSGSGCTYRGYTGSWP